MPGKSANVAAIEKWFGIETPHEQAVPEGELPQIAPGKIILITGPSGSGKSRLLRRQKAELKGQGASVIAADEFCALLDRVTACVVARNFRRLIDMTNIAAVLATSHDDLTRALQPDTIIRCDFNGTCHKE